MISGAIDPVPTESPNSQHTKPRAIPGSKVAGLNNGAIPTHITMDASLGVLGLRCLRGLTGLSEPRLSELLLVVRQMCAARVEMEFRHKQGLSISRSVPGGFLFSSRYAESLCPRRGDGFNAIRDLIQAGIIDKVRPGSEWARRASEYVFCLPFAQCTVELSMTPRLEKRLKIAREGALKRRFKRDPFLAWVDRTMRQIRIPPSEPLTAALMADDNRAVRGAIRVLACEAPWKPPEVGYAGTTYHFLQNLPRQLVPTLLYAENPICQLDISAAHPCTLPRMMRESVARHGSDPAWIQAAEQLTRDLESGRIYDTIGAELQVPPKTAKVGLLSAMNAKPGYTNNDSTFLVFARKYPEAAEMLRRVKRSSHKNQSRNMAAILAEAMTLAMTLLMNLGVPVFPRTDELVGPAEHREIIRDVLHACFLHTTDVNAMVGGGRPSHIPTEAEVMDAFQSRLMAWSAGASKRC